MSPDLLEEILVETRPAPDPAWAAEMDQLVERGFEREGGSPSPSSWRARIAGWRPMLVPALGSAASVLLVVVIAVSWPDTGDDDDAGFVSGGAEVSQSDTDGGGGSAASSGATAEKAPSAADSAGRSALGDEEAAGQLAPAVPGGAVPGEDRKVERFASLTLTAP